ncbi:hypothetical protein G3I59_36810 [Amycolatopsis rubida]|uniref:Helix-turn-helix domain-containing protein n=1 Tax=Amycolatopsis rubida TaxID=112413 RepID=A0ABX0BZJ2_9PSEU|nr:MULTISPECIES: hypothetical protein [Amycolatopsis]MYW96021.1 hypothetical protein [Amycolatopsis rubida]NEC61012.1 hypothetical protein [Amycolatopsis rubida]OAP20550.1 hypothetical protein A4R44_08710 [Amycolatopsis sp. M39]
MTTRTDEDSEVRCLLGCRTRTGEAFRAQHGYRTCDPCADELRADIQELARLYPELIRAAVPGGNSAGGRVSPGYGPRSPARDAVLALTDRRTRAEDEGDPHSVLEILSSWADNVRKDTGHGLPDATARREGQLLVSWLDFTAHQPWAGKLDTSLEQLREEIAEQLGLSTRTVRGESAFLVEWFDYITRQYWVGDFADEVRTLLASVRTATGTAESSLPVGTCPAPDETTGQPCGTRLRVRADADRIICPRCRTRWPRDRWDELSDAQGTPVSDVAALSAWLTVPAGTLRRWRSEDGWTNHGSRRRPLYERNAVLESWQRRRGALLAG